MGWLTFNWRGSAKEYFEKKYLESENCDLVDIAIVNFRTAYLAVLHKDSGVIFCMVYLLHRAPKSYYNFGYKDMSEFAGPVVNDCPMRIINKLTSIDEMIRVGFIEGDSNCVKWATNFRERVKEFHSFKFKSGMIIKSLEPIKFTYGYYQYFKKVGRKIYAILDYDTESERSILIKFNGIKNYSFEVIKK